MRILVLDTYYEEFLAEHFRGLKNAADLSYAQILRSLLDTRFGTGDAYAVELNRLGHQAETLVLNANLLQARWAEENGFAIGDPSARWHADVLVEQIRAFRPDVLYVQEVSIVNDAMLAEIRPYVGMIVGQIACSLPPRRTFEHHDLIVSSWLPIVEHFRSLGKAAAFLPLGFDHTVLEAMGQQEKRFDVSFVGGISAVHGDRVALLEYLCERLPIHVFGYGAETLPADSPILPKHRGQVWGTELYRTLASSRIAVNVHGAIDVRGSVTTGLANNARMFEATGCGTCLVTDAKSNLGDYFEPDAEVIAFHDAKQCVDVIEQLLAEPDRCASVAAAGQRRTLSEHTYAHRMAELTSILEQHKRFLRSSQAIPVTV